MSPDPFDDLDRALSAGLSALAPEVQGGDEALASMRSRFERARTRARVAKIGGAFAAVAVIGTAVALVAPSPTRSHVQVTAPSSTPTSRQSARSSTTPSSSTTTPVTRESTAPTNATSPTTTRTSPPFETVPTTPQTTPQTVPTTVPGDGGGPGPGDGHGGGPTTTVPASDGVSVYRTTGGSVTVRFFRGALSLVQVSPADGYGYEVHDSGPDRIDVRFTKLGQTRYRVDLRVENGQVVRDSHFSGSSGGPNTGPNRGSDGRPD